MMPDVMVKKRVHRLETLMAQLITTVDRVDQQLEQTDRQMEQTDRRLDRLSLTVDRVDQQLGLLSAEMREFKAEMRLSHERSDRDMHAFKAEMQASRDRADREMREFRQELGKLDRKMSTMTEDLVAPSIPNILHQIIGCPKDGLEFLAVRATKRHPVSRQSREFDVVAVCGDYFLITETKRRLQTEHVRTFAEETLPAVRGFFPEYQQKTIIGALASLYVDESVARFVERQGIYLLGVSGLMMEVLNSPDFVPATF